MSKWLVCFDLDWLYFTESSFHRFKEALAPNIGKEKRDHVLALCDEMRDFKKGIMSEDDYWDWVRKELNLSYSNEEISDILADSYEVDKQVNELADTLKAKGYNIWICSNNFPTRINAFNKRFWFVDKFDVHVFSYEVWVMKPDQEIFKILIDKSGIDADKIIYSDDKEEKIQWAKSLWIKTFVFHDFDEFVSDLKWCGIEI